MLTRFLEPYSRRVRRSIEEIRDPAWKAREAGRLVPDVERRIQKFAMNPPVVVAEMEGEEQPCPWDHMGPELLCFACGIALVDVATWYVTTRATQPQLNPVAVVIGSVALSAILSCGVHVLAGGLLSDPLRRARTLRRHVATWITGIGLAVVGFVWLLAARAVSAEQVGFFVDHAWIAFLCLNMGLPLSAGALSSQARFLMRRTLDERRRTRGQAQLKELTALREWLIRISRNGGGHPPPIPFPGGVAIILCIALVSGFVPTRATESLEGRCTVLRDESSSAAKDDLDRGASFFEDSALDFSNRYGCSAIMAGTFSDQGRFTARTWIVVPKAPQTLDCTSVPAERPKRWQAVFHELGFANADDLEHGRASARCESLAKSQAKDYAEEVVIFRSKLHDALRVDKPRSDVRSPIAATLRALLEARIQNRAVLIITDGLDTDGPIPNLTIPHGTTAFMVIGRPSHGPVRLGLDAAGVWQRAVNGLRVILTTELYPGIWQVDAEKGAS